VYYTQKLRGVLIMNNEKEFKDLPEGWKWARLEEVILYEQPQKYIVLAENYEDKSGIPVLTAGKTFILGFTNENFGICNNLPVILFDDFTTDSRFVNFPFKVKSSAAKLLRARDKNINLFYIFNAMQLIKLKPGSEHKRFWISEYSRLSIPLPPLPEQQKIAEILETIDNAIEKTDKIIEKYKRIKQGLMQDLLTKGIDENGNIRNEKTHKFKDSPLGRIPEEWEVVRLGEVGNIVSGSTPSTYNDEYWNGEIVWITPNDLSNIENIFIEDSSRKITQKGLKSCSAKIISANSVVVSSRAPIGYVKVSKVPFTTNQGCKSIEYNGKFSPIFLAFLLSNKVQNMINLGSGTTFQEISKSNLANLLIPLPPLPEQQRIAEILSQTDQAIEKEQQYKEKLQRIKQGLMEDLLTGKVRVNHLINEGEGYVSPA
jgi:type I restriction enzyme S subunit